MADGKLIFDVEFGVGNFKDALKDIEKATKTSMDGTAKQVEKTFKKTNETVKTSSKSIESNFKGMGKTIAGHLGNIATSMLSAFSVKTVITSAVELGTAFENGLAKVSTLIDTNNVDMKKWGKELVDISNQTGIALQDITESTYQALSASVKQADVNDLLLKSSKLAVAGYTNMTTVIDTTTSILNAYNLTSEDTERIHKILIQTQNKGKTTVAELGASLSGVIPIAVQMGIDLETLGASMATLTADGKQTAQATTELKALFTAFAKSGTETSKALFETYKSTKLAGKSFQDLLKVKPLNEILRDMSKYAKESGLNFAELFTSVEASSGATSLAISGYDRFTDSLQAMSTEADVVGEGFEKNLTTTKRWEIATNKLRNQSLTLFEMLLPAVEGFLKVASGVIDWFSSLNPIAKELVITMGLVAGVLGAIIPIIISLGVAGGITSTALLPIIGIMIAVGVAIGLGIVAVRALISALKDSDSGISKFVDGIVRGVIGTVNLAISAVNLLIRTLNLIPNVNIPLVQKLENKSRIEKEKEKKATQTNSGSATSVPKLARGGTVEGGSLFIAGEKGKELLITDRGKTTVIPLNSNNGIGSNNINLTFNVSGANLDERRLSDMVLTKLARNLRA